MQAGGGASKQPNKFSLKIEKLDKSEENGSSKNTERYKWGHFYKDFVGHITSALAAHL